MSDDPFARATREALKARIALTGPSGSGKTYTALALATSLADKVAAVDTEHGRMKEYAGTFPFSHFAPARFDPRELVKLLARAADNGYGAVIIDSFSHYWMGSGGALEFVDSHETQRGGKFSAGWKAFRPIETQMLDALLSYPGHVIATMRVKTAYVVEQDGGKSVPRKVGLKPEQREGIEYEFAIVGEMDRDHTMTVTKSTCPALVDQTIPRPGSDVADALKVWISGGAVLPDALEYRDQALDTSNGEKELRRLYNEVKARRLLNAAVVDGSGDETTLGELIVRMGNERKAAAA